jgi:hypothetical protein
MHPAEDKRFFHGLHLLNAGMYDYFSIYRAPSKARLCQPEVGSGLRIWTSGRNGTDMRRSAYLFHCYSHPDVAAFCTVLTTLLLQRLHTLKTFQ